MFCIVNKKRLLFLFKWAVEKSNNNTNSLDKLNLGNLFLLSISFCSIMGFAKHLAITFICGSTFVFGLPLTELCSTDRVDTITNRNDCIEVVELRHVILTICGSCRVFLGN